MKNKTIKILLILVLLLAVVTGALLWITSGKDTPVDPTEPVTEATTESTTEPTTEAATEAATEAPTEPETVPETTVPAPTETEPTEPAWEPTRLTQADFSDPLTDLTDEERDEIFYLQFSDFGISHRCEGEIGLTFPKYADLDLDKDGKTDSFFFTDNGFELRMGNGNVSALDVEYPLLGAGQSVGLLFGDLNGTGTDDILAVCVSHSTAGNLLSLTVFLDSGGTYYRQPLPDYKFYIEDLHNDYVRLCCDDFPYREVMLIGSMGIHPYLEEGETIFDYYFSGKSTDEYYIRNVVIDGNKLVVLCDFLHKFGGVTSNPFGVVYRLEPGGYFIIERMGTQVLRDYWLSVE